MTVVESTSPAANPLQKEIESLGPWFHNLHLPDGTQTNPGHSLGDFPRYKWELLGPLLPADLSGWKALDIGCNAGFYSIELAKRGAEVTGIDVDSHYLAQAQWAVRQFGVQNRVSFHQMQVYDLARAPHEYDLVLFMGVFYHLRYPMLGLDIVAQKVKRLMVFQTLTMPGRAAIEGVKDMDLNDREPLRKPGWPKMAFIENRMANDPTNWWIANHAAVEAMLRSAGLKVVKRPGHEIYLAEPDPEHPSCVITWNSGELLAATGRGPAPQPTEKTGASDSRANGSGRKRAA